MRKIKRLKMSEYIGSKTKPFITEQSPLINLVPDFLKNEDNQKMIASIMKSMFGDYALLDKYSMNPDQLAGDVTAWYAANSYRYKGLLDSTEFEYDPIENYRMVEEGQDTDSGNDVTTNNYGERHDSVTYGKTQTTQKDNVSPFETSDSYPRNQSTMESQEKTDSSVSDAREDKTTLSHGKKTDHKLTRSGNIGVTTSQQMIESERKVVDFSIIVVIVKDIMELTCLRVFPVYGDYIIVND